MVNDAHSPIRVLVVDDSFFMRKMLTEVLEETDGVIQVLDSAQNGLEALEKIEKLKPDVVTLDVEMPKMDGLEALTRIMAKHPTPVIMLSSHTGKGTETTIRALEAGAIDCVLKPTGKPIGDIRSVQVELVEKIKLASRSKLQPKLTPTEIALSILGKGTPKKPSDIPPKPAKFLVAVASSTGGPRALHEFLAGFPADFPAALVIVQHISVGFTKALARRLDEVSALTVTEAEDGENLLGGRVYLAPAGRHLTVKGNPGTFRTSLNDEPPRLGVRPSADILMLSVSKVAGKSAAGVVLTGMGKDGTEGLKAMRRAGAKTFAQDAESCVVYGMPKAAMDAGVIDQQLTLSQMAVALGKIRV